MLLLAVPATALAEPLVIGHRGASGYRPEHTLASYALAARMGADYVEPDLVSTKDGVLVARHENEIGGTTDVADHPEFADRRTTKTIDGTALTGWFTEDFTLAELRTLRAKERIPDIRQRNTLYDGRYTIPTFQEVINLTRRLSRRARPAASASTPRRSTRRTSSRSASRSSRRWWRRCDRNDLNRRDAKVFVQSFETANLQRARPAAARAARPAARRPDAPARTTSWPRAARRPTATSPRPPGCEGIAEYADGVGPSKTYIVPRNADGSSGTPTSFVDDAHAAGLQVHPYTFRNENQLPAARAAPSAAIRRPTANAFAEYEQFFAPRGRRRVLRQPRHRARRARRAE